MTLLNAGVTKQRGKFLLSFAGTGGTGATTAFFAKNLTRVESISQGSTNCEEILGGKKSEATLVNRIVHFKTNDFRMTAAAVVWLQKRVYLLRSIRRSFKLEPLQLELSFHSVYMTLLTPRCLLN